MMAVDHREMIGMSKERAEELLRWADVKTGAQRKKLYKQTIAAFRELFGMTERPDILGDVQISGTYGLVCEHETGDAVPVVNRNGVATRTGKYSDKVDVWWDSFRLMIGMNVPEPSVRTGWSYTYCYVGDEDELTDFIKEFGISAGDVYKVMGLLRV